MDPTLFGLTDFNFPVLTPGASFVLDDFAFAGGAAPPPATPPYLACTLAFVHTFAATLDYP